MTKLSIQVTHYRACVVVSIAGDLDKVSAPELEQTLTDLLAGGHIHLIADVSELDFCDSTGVWLLLSGLRRTFEAGGWLRLAGVRGFLQRLLELTRLSDAFPTDPTVAESLSHAPTRRSSPPTVA
ncbi:STAS domain-containing protein [Planomonospora sp. ID67723]|uniref:STAS domain-containing protein n=1 Tax=Planomonospora sp. ID67723 TaxID=2738134 RepID=UPI0018C416F9|nr:STAS domain-containing protein [Planomonospora sp. ID67723]MBG0827603.1 STAS domain-containing protein [Planomonospora sp. ID67723]